MHNNILIEDFALHSAATWLENSNNITCILFTIHTSMREDIKEGPIGKYKKNILRY